MSRSATKQLDAFNAAMKETCAGIRVHQLESLHQMRVAGREVDALVEVDRGTLLTGEKFIKYVASNNRRVRRAWTANPDADNGEAGVWWSEAN